MLEEAPRNKLPAGNPTTGVASFFSSYLYIFMGATSITGVSGPGVAFQGNKLAPLISTIQEYSQKTSKFLVGHDISDPYSTIQAAIDGAVASGNNQGFPAVVLVKPGTYKENITMHDGIAVKAVGDSNDTLFLVGSQAVVEGTVTFADTGKMYWEGVDVLNNAGVGFHLTGSNPYTVTISNCLVNTSGEGLLYDNTGSNSVVGLQSVNFVINSGVVIKCQPDATSILFFRDSVIGLFGQGSDVTVINHVSGVLLYYNGYVQGAINVAATANPSIYAYTAMATLAVVPITVAAGGGVVFVRSNVNTSAPFLATGTGQILFGDLLTLPGYAGSFDPALTQINFPAIFVPTTPSDWSPPPTDTQAALDQLAARVTALGG